MISLIGIIIVIIIVAGIVLATRSKETFHSESGTEGMPTARRLWLYLITLIALGIFAAGVGQLLNLLFDLAIKGSFATQVGRTNFNAQQLSLGLAMIVIGGPLWLFFWRAIQKRVKGNQYETGATLRKLFLNFVLIETSFMAIIAVSELFRWLLSGVPAAEFSASNLTLAIVGGVIWFYHWRVSEQEGQPSSVSRTLRRWYMYILAAFGLIWLAAGLVQFINAAVVNLPFWGDSLVAGHFWNNTTQLSISWMLWGGLTWYFHWFRMARGDFDSTLRQVYFYLLTISGGAITALVATVILLFRLFLWIFGGAPVSASPHFQFLGWAIPTIVVGLAIWGYHLRLVQEETSRIQEKRQSAQRVYLYLMSFLGLSTMAAGLSILLGILLDTGTSLSGTAGWWRNQLAVSLSLILVGTPLWLYYWNSILKRVQAGAIAEWRALSRRIFLYVIVGVSIVLLAADLVNIIYQLLQGMLQSNLATNYLHNAKWSLQTLIVAAAILWYHWQILRADQRRGAEAVLTRKDVTLLADDRSGEMAARLEAKLGYKIRSLYPVGQTTENQVILTEEDIDRITSEIQASPAGKAMVVFTSGKATVLPYQEK